MSGTITVGPLCAKCEKRAIAMVTTNPGSRNGKSKTEPLCQEHGLIVQMDEAAQQRQVQIDEIKS